MPIDYESWRVATTGGFLRRVDEILEDPLAPPQIAAITGGTIHRSDDVHDGVATVNGQVLAWDTSISQYKVRTVKDIYESQSDGQSGFSTDASGIVLRGGKRIKFSDDDASAGLSLRAAATMASDVTLTLPSTAPAGNQILRSNINTPTTLEWADSNRRSTREFLVTSYGAVCDGTTDDITAIQNAVNACGSNGTVTFPPGKSCRISATIIVSGNGVWMEGNGCKLIKNSQMDMIYVTGNYNVIRNFELDGGNSNWTGIFLVGSFNRALNNRIYNCGSYGNPGHGIGIGKDDGTCTRNLVMGNHISHCGEIGISQNQAKESIIVDNMVETCGAEGISIDVASDRGLVAHNVIKGCCAAGGVGGIGIDQVTMVSVIGNLIQDTGGSLPGIKFQNNVGPTTLVTITGNRLTGNVGGIHLSKNTGTGYATSHCHIGGNVIYSALANSYGVKIDAGCLFNKVLANQISVVTDSITNNGSLTLLDSIPAIPGNRALITNSGGTGVEWSGMGFNGTNAIASCLAMLGGIVEAGSPPTGSHKIVIGPSTHNGDGSNGVTMISPKAITTLGGPVFAQGIVGIGCASLIGDNNVVVGYASSAANHSSTVIGTFCSASTFFGTALGHWSTAGEHGIAIGTSDTGGTAGQTIAGQLGIAIGKTAKAGTRGIAIGPNSVATFNGTGASDASIAIGYGATASSGNKVVVIGAGASHNASHPGGSNLGVAIGANSECGSSGTAVGPDATATKAGVSLGTGTLSDNTAIACGNYTRADQGTVAIGAEVDYNGEYTNVCVGGVLIGKGVQAPQESTFGVLEPVIVGYNACRSRKVRDGVTVVGGRAARQSSSGVVGNYKIKDSTIIGYGMLTDYQGNIENRVMVGANGRELFGGTLPTTAYNHANEGNPQSNTGDGIFEIFGRIRLWTNNREEILEGEFVGKPNPLTHPCIRWRTYNANAPNTVVYTYDLNLY